MKINPDDLPKPRAATGSGESEHEARKIIAAGLSQMHLGTIKDDDDLTRLIGGARSRLKAISSQAELLEFEKRMSGTPVTKQFVVETLAGIQQQLLEAFHTYNKEELLLLLVQFNTEVVAARCGLFKPV